jgi:hypothetical protein
MTDIIFALFTLFFGAAAVVYGYMNWRITSEKKDLWWIFVGIIFILLVVFDFITTKLLVLSPQTHNVFHWIRLACDMGAVLLALTLKIKSSEEAKDIGHN